MNKTEVASQISSINVDQNLIVAIIVFIVVIVGVVIYVMTKTSKRDQRIISHRPVWHDFTENDNENISSEETPEKDS